MPQTKITTPVILGASAHSRSASSAALSRLVSAIELGATAMRECDGALPGSIQPMSPITSWACVVQAGLGQVPSRQAAFKAGLGREVTSDTINRVCASGMRAVTLSSDLDPPGPPRVDRGGRHGEHVQRPILLDGSALGTTHG